MDWSPPLQTNVVKPEVGVGVGVGTGEGVGEGFGAGVRGTLTNIATNFLRTRKVSSATEKDLLFYKNEEQNRWLLRLNKE